MDKQTEKQLSDLRAMRQSYRHEQVAQIIGDVGVMMAHYRKKKTLWQRIKNNMRGN